MTIVFVLFLFFDPPKKRSKKEASSKVFSKRLSRFETGSKTPRRFAPESRSFCSPILTKRSFPATPELNFIL